MNNLEYIRSGDYFIPNLTLSEQPQTPLGKYGRMRKTYLQEHRPAQYSHLLLSEKLYPHLLEVDQAANERLVQLMPQMAKAAGITSDRPNEVGRFNEHRQGTGGGNYFCRINLHLLNLRSAEAIRTIMLSGL